jgi:hypothetical protein
MLKIYIAGKITGEPLAECRSKFEKAEQQLRRIGAAPVNPFKLGIPTHFTFEESKPFNFKALRHCTAMFMLNDYTSSPGAMAELDEAQRLKLDIYYEHHNDYGIIEDDISVAITG